MKKITLLAIAAIMSVATFAQVQMKQAGKLDLRKMNVTSTATMNKIMKAAGDEVISEQPVGEEKIYERIGGQALVYNQQTGGEDVVNQDGLVKMVFAEDNTVYMQNPIYSYATSSWIKGTTDGTTITFPTNQAIYYSSGYSAYIRMAMMIPNGTEYEADLTIANVEYAIDGDNIKLVGTSQDLIFSAYWEDDNSWTGYGEWDTELAISTEEPTAAPEGLETTEYTFSAQGSSTVMYPVFIGKDGNKLYIKGMFQTIPDAWVVGEINGNEITFANGQYMAMDDSGPVYFCGSDDGSNLCDVVLTYDEEKDIYTQVTTYMIINGKKDAFYYWEYFTDGVFGQFEERAIAPANPVVTNYWPLEGQYLPELDFNPAIEDIEGQPLILDKLFFTIYLQRAGGELEPVVYDAATYGMDDVEMFPIYYTDEIGYVGYSAMNQIHYACIATDDDSDFEKMGVQSIYMGGGEVNRSHVVVYDITSAEIYDGIKDVNNTVKDNKYYTINGVNVDKPVQRGIYIQNGRKVVVK